MRICIICDSIYSNDTEECKECEDGGELIHTFNDIKEVKDVI